MLCVGTSMTSLSQQEWIRQAQELLFECSDFLGELQARRGPEWVQMRAAVLRDQVWELKARQPRRSKRHISTKQKPSPVGEP